MKTTTISGSDVEDRTLINAWPSQPRTLKRSIGSHTIRATFDVFAVLASIPFLVLAGIAINRHNKEVKDDDWRRIQRGMSAAVTAFPILFAAVTGRMTRAVATWRLERGAPLGSLEQLFWSNTIISAITTQIFMKSFNLLGLGLIVLWALSPLGGQSSLHIIDTERDARVSSVNVTYLSSQFPSEFSTGSDIQSGVSQLNAIYLSSLLSPQSSKESTMDIWGNVKIPAISGLDRPVNSSGWRDVKNHTSLTYTSLLGVPFQGLEAGSNTTFQIETSYLDIDCYDLQRKEGLIPFSPPTINKTVEGAFLGTNGSEGCSVDRCSPSWSLGINQYVTNYPYWSSERYDSTLAYCHINQIYVEVFITCIGTGSPTLQCAVAAMRDSLRPHPARDVTPFIFPALITNFAKNLVVAGSGHAGTNTLTERFINDPANPLAADVKDNPLFKLPKQEFSERLTQIINTYYLGSISTMAITGNMSAASDRKRDPGPFVRFANGTLVTWEPYRYVVSPGWMTVFVVSSVVMLVAAMYTAVIMHITNIPDILGYVSTLTRDNEHSSFPHGGSMLDGLERSHLLKDMPVRLGDVRAGEPNGYLALTGSGLAQRAERDRLYE
ncbi:uncharacterized protein BDW43DRAFT_322431 [Aspergillus alliaceus]|uniref:uncharacterized protein n=1 Tax=Petromyces alliaceus TaxID=209559 RepID=UPI0012A7092B|nr:uncharacterized protein BDW43DRAFT_322431 [Aspergillus alliaceus]KAB8229002.1 hypothetical protein BDW43DRAFT_322431 [Aspergillus alliaceus]